MPVKFVPDIDNLRLVVSFSEGRCTVEFIGCWAPRELSYAQKAIGDQYRAERRKIAQGYRKSTQYMKTKTRELKEKERELKYKEERSKVAPLPPNAAGVLAQQAAQELSAAIDKVEKNLGVQDASTRQQEDGRGQCPADGKGTNTSGTVDQDTGNDGATESSVGTAEGPELHRVPQAEGGGKGSSGK